MCGIWAVFGLEGETLACVCQEFSRISHRGPDAFNIEYDQRIKNGYIGFHRLSIVDGLSGMQPMRLCTYPHIFLLCNGEIYNFKQLGKEKGFQYMTKCDVEAIVHLYANTGAENVARSLDGVFAFCLVDIKKRRIIIARDPYGVRPLFILQDRNGHLGICSETKGLIGITNTFSSDWTIKPFPPGFYEEYEICDDGKANLLKSTQFFNPGDKPTFQPFIPWTDLGSKDVHGNIRKLLVGAVQKRLMSERRIGCFLSGGLDSSLIAALLASEAKNINLPYKLQSFAIGMSDSPDIIAARQVAEYIGTEHHEIIFTEEDVVEVLDKLIYHLETFDITTIRASIGMYILSKYVKTRTDTTVIFSGEGADELAQGYIYFKKAPNANTAHQESIRLLKDIYLYDGLRADRTTSAFSLELRVPFLDLQFTHYYLSLSPSCRLPQDGIEKHLLRSAFMKSNLLPKNILWRHKEAFSDGITSTKKTIIEIIEQIVSKHVDDNELQESIAVYPHCTPLTKEALYYRYDFADPVLQRLKLLAPEIALSHRERETTPSLHTLMLLMPRIIDRNNLEKIQKIDDEWRALPFQRERFQNEMQELKNPEVFWHKVYIFEDDIGERLFSTIGRFALEVLSMPIANADCERMFSKINDVKTKKRNKLITSTVCGLLHADAAVRDSGNCCVAFEPRKTMYDKMISTNIYKSSTAEDEDQTVNDVDNIFAGLEE